MQIAGRIKEVRPEEIAAGNPTEKPSQIWARGMPLVLVARIASGFANLIHAASKDRV